MRTRFIPALLVAAVAVAPLSTAAAPKKKEKGGDRSWTHPEFARFGVDRIAMVPVVTYNNDLPGEKQVEGVLAQSALSERGFRWISAGTTREMLRIGNSGDSLFKLVKARLLNNPRVDSLMAPQLCSRLRCDALLTVRIDQWEKREIEPGQSGKPATSVQLKAALVDKSGTLLWSVGTSETAEGPYQDASSTSVGISGGRLVSAQGGAPDFVEVMTTVAKRWAGLFPPKAAPAASGAPDSLKSAPAPPAAFDTLKTAPDR